MSFKRVHRLWKLEPLRVRRPPKRQPTTGHGGNSCDQLKAKRPNQVWTWHFFFDRPLQSQPLKWFSIADEYTRQCITLDIGRRMTSEDVIDRLATLVVMYGVPACIRSDNGPKFVAKAIQRWLASLEARTLYVEPGSSRQSGYVESSPSRLRDELLNLKQFDSARHARANASASQDNYNGYRLHRSLDGLTPNEFARRRDDSAPPAAQAPLHHHTDIKSVTPKALSKHLQKLGASQAERRARRS